MSAAGEERKSFVMKCDRKISFCCLGKQTGGHGGVFIDSHANPMIEAKVECALRIPIARRGLCQGKILREEDRSSVISIMQRFGGGKKTTFGSALEP